jgi:hypothetical protein
MPTWVLLLFFFCTCVRSYYGSAFEQQDSGPCLNPNVLTGSCSCPSTTVVAGIARVLSTIVSGGYVFVCAPPEPQQDFGGTYQLDDNVPGGKGCRIGNRFAGGTCSCPNSMSATSLRVIVDTPGGGMIGSHFFVCGTSGGVFQKEDDGLCLTQNPVTNDCTCPQNFVEQNLRAIVDKGTMFSGSYIVMCVQAIPDVTLCDGSSADPSGKNPADAAIQKCIDQTPAGGTFEIPAGLFLITNQITITNPITIQTANLNGAAPCWKGSNCATFLGSPLLYNSGGIIRISDTNNVILDHIIVDGNRANRVNTPAWNECPKMETSYGYNMQISNCDSCSFTNSISRNAVCGTGCEWTGNGANVLASYFHANGDHFTHMMWSDGLTLLHSDSVGRQTLIMGNVFEDNSDVDFISGGCTNGIIQDNLVEHIYQPSYAGMMFDNFDGDEPGDFTGALISQNRINCGSCTYGLNIGPHGWYMSRNVIGGNFSENTIDGAFFLLNVDGAGSPDLPISIENTNFGNPVFGQKCGHSSTEFVICPNGTFVNSVGPQPTLSVCLDGCIMKKN